MHRFGANDSYWFKDGFFGAEQGLSAQTRWSDDREAIDGTYTTGRQGKELESGEFKSSPDPAAIAAQYSIMAWSQGKESLKKRRGLTACPFNAKKRKIAALSRPSGDQMSWEHKEKDLRVGCNG